MQAICQIGAAVLLGTGASIAWAGLSLVLYGIPAELAVLRLMTSRPVFSFF